ncbi:unnamed protein product [Rhizophagus irregularis]|nr:unnamed protein product [Rhizophagus irregularis]CAB5313087.1 unnamed protein product [Rhizophagus irregularis]
MSSPTSSDIESNIQPKPKHPGGRPVDPYLTIIVNAEENQNVEPSHSSDVNKRRKIEQTTLNDHWDDTTEIPNYRQKIIDQAWLKAFD